MKRKLAEGEAATFTSRGILTQQISLGYPYFIPQFVPRFDLTKGLSSKALKTRFKSQN